MLGKKMSELTVGESLIISGCITVVCFLPTVVWLAWEPITSWIKERRA